MNSKLETFRRAAESRHEEKQSPKPQPCQYAEFKRRRACCGDYWLCKRPGGAYEGVAVNGKFCRNRCKERVAVRPSSLKPVLSEVEGPVACPELSRRACPEQSRRASSLMPHASSLPLLSMVITSCNEDLAEVKATIESALAAYPHDKLEIILIDDGSTTPIDVGALREAPVRLVRHKTPLGVGRSRNEGYGLACGTTAFGCDDNHVISFHDAHMRFPLTEELLKCCKPKFRQELEAELVRQIGPTGQTGPTESDSCVALLARKAAETGALISSASRDVRPECSFWASGADLFWNRHNGLEPKWRIYTKDMAAWQRMPCPMGAAYFISRETAQKLTGASGQLWEDTAGRWGMSEQVIAVKCFLLDVPVIASRDVFTRHLYRSRNPVDDAATAIWRNYARATWVLLSDETFDLRCRPHILKRMSAAHLKQITDGAGAERERFRNAVGANPDKETAVFTWLCGKGAKITAIHPDHEWLGALLEAAQRLGQTDPTRILQWRPGESTLLIKKMRPDTEIISVETPGHRADNWWDICQAKACPERSRGGVKLIKCDVGPNYPQLPLRQNLGKFDLVIVGGEMQDECMKVAPKLLREGGQIIRNERADHLQIEDAERHKEEKARRKEKETAVRQAPGREPSITVLLLNYRRMENIGPILDGLAAQTVRPKIFLWNNGDPFTFTQTERGGTKERPIAEHPLIGVAVQSSRNLVCFPRWWLASIAETEFVCCMDDDLVPKDPRVLADAMAACREECPDGIVGFFGVSEVEGKGYKNWRHHNGTTTGTRCDLIKGRFMLFRTELLSKVPMRPPEALGTLLTAHEGARIVREDDIYLSLMIGGGRRGAHLIPARLAKRFKSLPEHGTSMASQGGHYELRGAFYRALKGFLNRN